MALSDKAMQRLAQLGYAGEADLEFWRELWQSEGESFFWFFLRKKEKAAEEYRRWFPRLQAFAVECRRAVPVPTVESFSAVEREQYRVLLGKMQEFVASEDRRCILGRKPNQAAIVSTTRVGLAAAEQVFAGSGAVLLQEEERKRWFCEVYPIDHEAFWWYAFAWWSVRERLAGEDEESICGPYPTLKAARTGLSSPACSGAVWRAVPTTSCGAGTVSEPGSSWCTALLVISDCLAGAETLPRRHWPLSSGS